MPIEVRDAERAANARGHMEGRRRADRANRAACDANSVLSGRQPVARLDTGARDTVCPHCGALLWREERATLCCSGGKVNLDPLPAPPPLLRDLWTGDTLEARTFRQHSRRLNTALSLASMMTREDFIHAAELPEEEVQQQRLVVSADARPADQHPRRYNRAEGFREVAVLMDEEPVHQDIVLRRRADAEGPFLQTVNETHRAFEALHFVLLLPFGTDGWQPDLRQAVANGRGDVRGVSLMQYYAHRLQLRPDLDDSLFRAGRLFQEYVCMAFARVETQRLLYLARNQAGLRAELYQRLQDALPGDAERELAGGDRVGQRVILPASFTGGPRYYQRSGSRTWIALQVHLEDHQLVYFEPGQERQAAQAARRTHLTAWLEYNRESAAADPDCRRLLYPDFPSRYTWQAGQKVWRKRRQQQAAEAIGRVVSLSPRHGDVFYLRVLLHHVAGAASFEELRTVDGVVCATYREACCLRGLLQDDREWEVTMEDAAHAQMPAQIRRLFVTLLLFCAPADPSELFRRHLDAMSDDFGRRHRDLPDELRAALTLVELERQLQQAGKELRDFGLPEVTPDQRARAAELQQAAELRQLPRLIQEELEYDAAALRDQVVDACLRRSALWRHFIVAPLLENMRARRAAGPDGPELRAFCDWLLELGEGRAEGPEDGFVQLPPHLVMDADIDAVIDWVFDDLAGRHAQRKPGTEGL
ncbi:hypothetical protein FJT64_019452 [Amphibalanus amphitrite]|uniref:ATP-dependent DNA helicase n=1 Tax=Amphibalanus amphitrite TaxID=1232801 RepID=A0A6A4WZZ6_AMPAM|nr:hypothetical protein FJT64_019452 [Amphibalanus amphitrite]